MSDNISKYEELQIRLDSLLKKQVEFSQEINQLKIELNRLKISEMENAISEPSVPILPALPTLPPVDPPTRTYTVPQDLEKSTANEKNAKSGLHAKSNLEKFIGENLISKIGVVITIIGVAIGAKYAIDNEMINPLTRIVLGYLFGIGMFLVALRLKKNYENFSAVLMSGAMAIMYFITFFAYDFYALFPQIIAFLLMLIFTVFTVFAALQYNRQIIAHLGLVGAYAVPLLLSNNSGDIVIMFSYMACINVGILVLSFMRNWKALLYSSFAITWLVYMTWYFEDFDFQDNIGVPISFLTIFFVIFYVASLAYKLLQKEKISRGDVILLLLNSFIFYGFGYNILVQNGNVQLLGLFTLFNAVLHFGASVMIYRHKLADRNLFYLVSGLVLIFITIAIPVQLDGNWVTMMWAGEAALLFWLGRTKNIGFYEKLSYPLMLLATVSLMQDWSLGYSRYYFYEDFSMTPIFNTYFLNSLMLIAAFGFINFLNRCKKYSRISDANNRFRRFMSFAMPAVLIGLIYFSFYLEITHYFDALFKKGTILTLGNLEDTVWGYDLTHFKNVWLINYSLVFFSLLAFVNFKRFKNKNLGAVNLILITISLFIFLVFGLFVLSELQDSYLTQDLAPYFHVGIINILIRYISFVFVGFAVFVCHKYINQKFMSLRLATAFGILLHFVILWTASSELIYWMNMAGNSQSYKLGLSILWGLYSFLLIALGIWKKKRYLRIGAIVLFGVTLVKLFIYDIGHLNTISKTIVFVILGILLLSISFLYNKYKHIISDEADN
ncbi:MAG: DUF2339 domain-containing protein [Bacteroidales bacterium]